MILRGQRHLPQDRARVTVDATACSPLVYQWFHNGSQVSGATTSSLQLTGAHLADAGTYTVSVANSQGSTLSAAATVTVQQVATPTFSPAGGASPFPPQQVVVACSTADATIHYRIDGQDPTEGDATVASGGTVNIYQSLTLKAKAWHAGAGWAPSDVETVQVSLTTIDTQRLVQ